jgi:hypothetical protein
MKQMPAAAELKRAHRVRIRRPRMAKVIEFRVPENFVKPAKWVPEDQRGKIVEFPAQQKKSA